MTAVLIIIAICGWLVALWAIHHANRWHDTCLREREGAQSLERCHDWCDGRGTATPIPGQSVQVDE